VIGYSPIIYNNGNERHHYLSFAEPQNVVIKVLVVDFTPGSEFV
jgi:hypothetical protein